MIVQVQRETLNKVEEALIAVIDQYEDDDYEEGDSYAVALSREALAAIQSELASNASPDASQRVTTDH